MDEVCVLVHLLQYMEILGGGKSLHGPRELQHSRTAPRQGLGRAVVLSSLHVGKRAGHRAVGQDDGGEPEREVEVLAVRRHVRCEDVLVDGVHRRALVEQADERSPLPPNPAHASTRAADISSACEKITEDGAYMPSVQLTPRVQERVMAVPSSACAIPVKIRPIPATNQPAISHRRCAEKG